ncbi:MAG: hypothetical protein ABIQ31_23865 [Ferruginibacter sp.]
MIHIFKLSTVFILLFTIPGITMQGKVARAVVDKTIYYKALAGSDLTEVNAMLDQLEKGGFPEKAAYEGALLMKKAGLVKKISEKLSFFKSGRAKLEEAIKNNGGNVEYHFLRLIIQENAPKIVRYRGNLTQDTKIVRTSFNKLPAPIQQIVKEYSKNSKILNPADF